MATWFEGKQETPLIVLGENLTEKKMIYTVEYSFKCRNKEGFDQTENEGVAWHRSPKTVVAETEAEASLKCDLHLRKMLEDEGATKIDVRIRRVKLFKPDIE